MAPSALLLSEPLHPEQSRGRRPLISRSLQIKTVAALPRCHESGSCSIPGGAFLSPRCLSRGDSLGGGAAASVLRSHWFCEKLPRRAVMARKYSGGFSLGVTDRGGETVKPWVAESWGKRKCVGEETARVCGTEGSTCVQERSCACREELKMCVHVQVEGCSLPRDPKPPCLCLA